MIATDDIIRRARDLEGTRFLHQGREPSQGLDCVGLVLAIYPGLAFLDEDPPRYGEPPETVYLTAAMSHLDPVDGEPLDAIGSILWMRVGRLECHLSIVLPDRYHIHAQRWKRVRCEPIGRWSQRVVGGFWPWRR